MRDFWARAGAGRKPLGAGFLLLALGVAGGLGWALLEGTAVSAQSEVGAVLGGGDELEGLGFDPLEDPETAFVVRALAPLQQRAVSEGRPLCGFLAYSGEEDFTVSAPVVGPQPVLDSPSVCNPGDAPEALEVFAAFRILGPARPGIDAEVPLMVDLGGGGGGAARDLDLYLVTPGGRLWLVTPSEGIAFRVCDRGCLPEDPAQSDSGFMRVREDYSIGALRARRAASR